MKRMTAFILAAVLATAMLGAAALAETKITVTGAGEVRVSADTAVISLGVSARDREVLKAQGMVNETIAAIRKALAAKGLEEENITTEFINIYAAYEYQNDQEQLTDYNASTTLAIRTTDMASVGLLIDAAFEAGANTLNGISFSASDTAEAEAEALRLAAGDARRKAEVLAEASGLRITGTESITEGSVYSYQNSVGNVYTRAAGKEADAETGDAGTVVQSAKLIVSASVSVTFEAVEANAP